MQSMRKSILHNLDPVQFAEDVLDFHPDDWQKEVLRYSGPRLMMLCSRQSGKSTIAALKGLHCALHYPNSLTLIISPSQRQSSELFKVITQMMNNLPVPPVKVEDNKMSVTLLSGSRIVSLPANADTIRGYSAPDVVLVDEASRTVDGVYYAIRPFFATGKGQLIALSTPNGRFGWFFDAWESEQEWKKIKVVADDCPRISKEFLASELEALGRFWYSQEYECLFVENENSVFRYSDILDCFDQNDKYVDLWGDDE
jgi:hypothetical protein